ncbi:hypothetical protein TSOC_010110 [Tetrabaena socialis]|uniref:Uncharacterized protein n=1 Tax=Tetrabaena socialis TaxID=47790 RepID=A0A2J7ZU60_9CHLO|nr:hypothetical protein TSOC_010110 [Tetrabaena socialis]|eukprot:PNH03802.1 hypothetical protein TSOC_010110 [Tetrabaena socialis]
MDVPQASQHSLQLPRFPLATPTSRRSAAQRPTRPLNAAHRKTPASTCLFSRPFHPFS